jgi:ADP-heptose:LPS heptosyltransferase
MLGAPEDKPHESWQLSEEEVMTGVSLDWLAAVMQKAKLVITIDNGMGHLADSQDAKHILMYPMCLNLGFIVNWGANNMVPIQIEPNEVQSIQLMSSIRKAAKHLGVS